jgi:ubiquinone/menaquinone biosynthesis C-methylase UbiE
MSEEIKRREATEPHWPRWDYKAVWTDLSDTLGRAKMYIAATEDEGAFARSGRVDADFLREKVGVNPTDTVLEIGCGVGRVGTHLAPHCGHWIGCDVSPNMVKFARERLAALPNVELVETPGYDLAPIKSASADVVYCIVVFCHIDEWDRYRYVEEAFRVLRQGGRICINNVNLCSDAGWAVFETLRKIHPTQRPPYIARCSTPAELEEYLKRAGFGQIQTSERREFIWVGGAKPA